MSRVRGNQAGFRTGVKPFLFIAYDIQPSRVVAVPSRNDIEIYDPWFYGNRGSLGGGPRRNRQAVRHEIECTG